MTTTLTEIIQTQLVQILAQLPQEQQKKVLKFAVSLHQQNLAQQWDKISEQEAASLKTEFETEDLAFAEANLSEYFTLLQQEDQA
jgi:predicted DNA-binding WGR domain protein